MKTTHLNNYFNTQPHLNNPLDVSAIESGAFAGKTFLNTTNQPLVGPILHCFEKCFLKNDEMDDESARFPMQNSMRYNPEENSSQSSESDRMSRKRKWFQLETE